MCSKLWNSQIRRASLAVVVALVCVAPAKAAIVAHYTFDDVDTTVTGDGSMADPFHIELADASGNGNTAINIATQLSQLPMGETNVYGAAIQVGAPGKFGQSHKFFRDPSVFQDPGGGGVSKESANTTYYVDAADGTDAGSNGDIPDGTASRTFSLWFSQEADAVGQDKLFGYGDQFGGEAFDVGLNQGGIELRHFGGQVVYGSGLDFDGDDAGWHHLAVRVNDGASTFSGVDVFLDGMELSGSGAVSVTLNTSENLDGFGIGSTSIEAFMSAQNGLQGWLDEFRIYDTALDDMSIMALANPGLTGDYNGNNILDAADYSVWRDALTAGATSLLNDPTPGTVDETDFMYWRTHFGESLGVGTGSGAAALAALAVPEPTTLLMSWVVGSLLVRLHGRRGPSACH